MFQQYDEPITKRTPRHIRIAASVLLTLIAGGLLACLAIGCGIDTKINAIASGVQTLVDNSSTSNTAGRDLKLNDTATLRILAFGLVIIACSYPAGKIIWLLTHKAGKKAKSLLTRKPPQPPISLTP